MATKKKIIPTGHTRAVLSPEQRAKIRGRTMCDDRAIRRWESGAKVHASTAASILRACGDLGIEVLA
jgi:hypothetical protein